MSKIRVNIRKQFPCTAAQLYPLLAEHETLGKCFFPIASFTRIRDGHEGRNSEGSVRKITMAGIVPFYETYTRVIANERLEYVVSGILPMKNHLSVMAITPTESGCELHYTSQFDGTFPGIAAVFGPSLTLAMHYAFYRLAAEVSRTMVTAK